MVIHRPRLLNHLPNQFSDPIEARGGPDLASSKQIAECGVAAVAKVFLPTEQMSRAVLPSIRSMPPIRRRPTTADSSEVRSWRPRCHNLRLECHHLGISVQLSALGRRNGGDLPGEFEDGRSGPGPDVEAARSGGRILDRCEHRVNNVVDIDEITHDLAVLEYFRSAMFAGCAGEERHDSGVGVGQ